MRRNLLLGATLCLFLLPIMPARLAAGSNKSDKPLPGQGKLVFVQDFELEVQDFKGDSSLVSKLPEGPLPRPHVLRGNKEDPATQAKKLVDSMSINLVKDLGKQGFNPRRLMPGDPMPSDGWLLHGVFTEVDEGNRVHRAVIGFGAGAAKMSLYADISDLGHAHQPLYTLAETDTSGHKPGAAITLNPIAAGVKFVMEKNASEKTVKKTASDIVSELVKKMNTGDAATPK
jgi:Domain of unknown function (DUF4410)